MKLSISKDNFLMIAILCIIGWLGIFVRFYQIAMNDFIFYDEGYYLNYNRFFHEIFTNNYPDNFKDLWFAFVSWSKLALGSGKALWFFLVDTRIFFGAYKLWFFPRIISAIASVLTIGVTYIFAKKFFNSQRIAILSAVFLCVLPSHVFYSRLAMQESFSALCFLGGLFFYIYPRDFGKRTFLSAILFACAFFTNYRLIYLPIHIICFEGILCYVEKRKIDFRKFIWHALIFFGLIFLIGSLDEGKNTVITFAWMFNQANLATHQFDIINFFSYPYYLFRLEHFTFAILFFGNIYLIAKKQWKNLIPFVIVCLQMFIFSFAGEKGARYLVVIYPLMVMSVACFCDYLLELKTNKNYQLGVIFFIGLSVVSLGIKSMKLAQSKSDYRTAMEYLKTKSENPQVITTQKFIINLYAPYQKDVVEFSRKFRKFLEYDRRGYRYLIVGPQAYISWAEENQRFNPNLISYLRFIDSKLKPMKEFEHFNDLLLERFAFEHSTNLRQTIEFLESNKGHYGKLRIYDVKKTLAIIDSAVNIKELKMAPEYKRKRVSDRYGR